MKIKAQTTKLGIIIIFFALAIIWFGGLGAGLSEMACTNAVGAEPNGLMTWFICNFFGVGVAIFMMIFLLAVVFF